MSSRRLITAVVVAAAACGLAACEPDGTPDGAPATAAAGAPSASAPAAAPSASRPAKAAPTTGSPSQAADDDPGMTCTEPKLAPGHKVVMPVARPVKDTMFAKPVKFVCDPNDGHYEGTGTEKSYLFAPKVKAQLVTDTTQLKTVVVGDLWVHIGDCLDGGKDVKPPLTCSAFPAYEIAQDSSGNITEIKEIWHS